MNRFLSRFLEPWYYLAAKGALHNAQRPVGDDTSGQGNCFGFCWEPNSWDLHKFVLVSAQNCLNVRVQTGKDVGGKGGWSVYLSILHQSYGSPLVSINKTLNRVLFATKMPPKMITNQDDHIANHSV